MVKTQDAATLDSSTPDLRALSFLPANAALINSPPSRGVPVVILAPPLSAWREDRSVLSFDLSERSGWQYEVVSLDQRRVLDTGTLQSLRGLEVDSGLASAAGSDKTVHFSLAGRPAITNGDFASGPWGSLGDCNNVGGLRALQHMSAAIRGGAAPNAYPALRLAASEDSACQAQWVDWRGGSLYVALSLRRVAGLPPRVCVWEVGPDHCAAMPPMPEGYQWSTYRAVVTP